MKPIRVLVTGAGSGVGQSIVKALRISTIPIKIIETRRLILRCAKLSDADDTFEYTSDPQVTKHTFWHTHHSLRDSQQLLSWLTAENLACWSIIHNAGQKVIGMCFLHSFNLQHRRAEIAFNLSAMKNVIHFDRQID